MSTELTLKGIFLEKFNRIVNPNFETKFISMLLWSGISLLGYQRVIQLASSIEILSADYYVKLSLSSDTDTFFVIFGSLMVVAAVTLFFVRYKNGLPKKLKSYKSLSKAAAVIRPIMDDNRRVFTAFGPNSNYGNVEELRQDFEVWEELKINQIVPNNDEILSILNRVKNFKVDEDLIVEKMKSHIQAFKKHCSNPNFSYTEHQFPMEFADLIFSYCKSTKNNISKYTEWLNKELGKSSVSIESAHIFGSALYGQEKTDVDIIIKTSEVEVEKIRDFSLFTKQLRKAFEDDFSLKLHLKVFSQRENVRFISFLDKIYAAEKVI